MTEFAFLILMTFSAPDQVLVENKQVMCQDIKCVEKFEADAKDSPTLQRFRVWRREDGRFIAGSPSLTPFPPIIDWSPL